VRLDAAEPEVPPAFSRRVPLTPPLRVEIFEPFAGWHHTKYIAMLLPALERLLRQGALHEVVVTTTDSHRTSRHFRDHLERFASTIRFDTFSADYRTLDGDQVSRALLASVRRNCPDFVVSTSANNGALSTALRSLATSPLRNGRVSSIGILHNGFVTPPQGIRDRSRDLVHRVSRFLTPWSEVGTVNPLLFDTIRKQGRWSPANLRLLPDPVEQRAPISKSAARAALGIPVDGTYVVQIGKTDPRKAVPELLRAFRETGPRVGVRLLLAGELYPTHRALTQGPFRDLVEAGSIVVIDRYLTPDEMHLANQAADVIAVTYYTDELSGTLLAATAGSRPVIASDNGYTGMMIERFGVGWGCEVTDRKSFARALAFGIAGAHGFSLTPRARRLLEFHDPENFSASVFQALYRRLNIHVKALRTWEWVLTGEAASSEHDIHGGHC
jgi:glycosyltransferase involved in cell wall biosynthesis